MVTRIEIRNYFQKKLAETPKEVIAELPDIAGEHNLESGESIDISFERDSERGYKYVRLGIGNLKALHRKGNKRERVVNISNEGKGSITLSEREVLFVSTNATQEQFTERK